jgi:hypothetical protein
MRKDFLGNIVDVGDYIFYSTTSRWPESRLAKIVRFTEKSVFVDVVKNNRPHDPREKNIIVKNDFVKVSYTEKV